jgi:mannose-6-phosphate isomerase-like protein (cupin superfamily)
MVTHMATTSKDELKPEVQAAGIDIRGTQLGDLAVGFESWPVGDYHALFEGLPHGCEASHHGYVLEGRARIKYDDGTTEEIRAGQAYVIPAGHHIEVLEAARVVEFTPVDGGYETTMKAIEKNLPRFLEMQTA